MPVKSNHNYHGKHSRGGSNARAQAAPAAPAAARTAAYAHMMRMQQQQQEQEQEQQQQQQQQPLSPAAAAAAARLERMERQQQKRLAEVVHNFEAESDGDLALTVGDIVVLTKAKEGEAWWKGYIQGNKKVKGLFPASFVQVLEPEPVPEQQQKRREEFGEHQSPPQSPPQSPVIEVSEERLIPPSASRRRFPSADGKTKVKDSDIKDSKEDLIPRSARKPSAPGDALNTKVNEDSEDELIVVTSPGPRARKPSAPGSDGEKKDLSPNPLEEYAKATWAFVPTVGQEALQLRLAKGDIVTVIERGGQYKDWVKVRRGTEEGYVPATYINTLPAPVQAAMNEMKDMTQRQLVTIHKRLSEFIIDESKLITFLFVLHFYSIVYKNKTTARQRSTLNGTAIDYLFNHGLLTDYYKIMKGSFNFYLNEFCLNLNTSGDDSECQSYGTGSPHHCIIHIDLLKEDSNICDCLACYRYSDGEIKYRIINMLTNIENYIDNIDHIRILHELIFYYEYWIHNYDKSQTSVINYISRKILEYLSTKSNHDWLRVIYDDTDYYNRAKYEYPGDGRAPIAERGLADLLVKPFVQTYPKRLEILKACLKACESIPSLIDRIKNYAEKLDLKTKEIQSYMGTYCKKANQRFQLIGKDGIQTFIDKDELFMILEEEEWQGKQKCYVTNSKFDNKGYVDCDIIRPTLPVTRARGGSIKKKVSKRRTSKRRTSKRRTSKRRTSNRKTKMSNRKTKMSKRKTYK